MINKCFTAAFIVILYLTSGCSSLAKNGALIRAENHYAEGAYQDSIHIIERALRQYDYNDEEKSSLLFLKALNYQKVGDHQTAYILLNYIAYTYPETEYGFRSLAILNEIKSKQVKRTI